MLQRRAVVARLPKTRSGKILRGTMRGIADGSDDAVPSTIDDPAILDEIAGGARRAWPEHARDSYDRGVSTRRAFPSS